MRVGGLSLLSGPVARFGLAITGLLPSPLPVPGTPRDTLETRAAQEQEQIVHDSLQRVRYCLTLKTRPPFRVAGQEMFVRLQEVARSVDQLLRHRPEPRLRELGDGLRQALRLLQPACRVPNVAADWLARLAAVLDPARLYPQAPARTAQAFTGSTQAVGPKLEGALSEERS